jgi:uncharacterized protein YbjT (DUF2867 family)
MLATTKVIAIVGATGNQGGSLVNAILDQGEMAGFSIRALVHNVQSEKAQQLRERGVEVIYCDINDEDSIVKAIEGAYGFFCVSYFWPAMNPDHELRQIKNMANAAKRVDIKHVVWSTFEDSRRRLPVMTSLAMPSLGEGARFKVPQCDSKGEGDTFFKNAAVPTTFMMTSFFWENFLSQNFCPKKTGEDKYVLAFPMEGNKRLPGIAVEDIGRCALDIFQRPDEYVGKHVGIASEVLTLREITAKIAYALGRVIDYEQIGFDDYRKLPFPGAVELGNMFQFFNDCEEDLVAVRSVQLSRKLNPKLLSFSEWLDKNKEALQQLCK